MKCKCDMPLGPSDVQQGMCQECRIELLHCKLAQAEETADHFKGRADEYAAKLAQAHKDYGCELLDPPGTIWDHAAKVQAENAELKMRLQYANGKLSEAFVKLEELRGIVSEGGAE